MPSCSGKLVPRNISRRTIRSNLGLFYATEGTEAEKFVSASSLRSTERNRDEVRFGETPKPTRETRALPGVQFSMRWNTIRIELTFRIRALQQSFPFSTCPQSERAMRINIAPFQRGDELQLLAYAFGTAVGGTGTFNFRQSAAKRGSSL
jgi:hypothetical protein